MKMQSIDDLLYTGMTYVLDFEQQISKEAGKMKYAERLQAAFSKIGAKPDTNDNHLAKAMINEVENMISNTDASPVRDAALIVAFNQQQAYRVASYGSLTSYAKVLAKNDAVSELQQSLDESKQGDEKLTNIAETRINKQAAQPVTA